MKIENQNTISNDNESSKDTNSSSEKNVSKKSAAIIRRIVLIIAAFCFCFSAVMLIKIFLEYKQGDDIYNNIQDSVLDNNYPSEITIDDKKVEVPFRYNHQELLSINPEGVGYLYIPSIDLRLPIVHPSDNDFYLTHTFNKTENKDGCLFEDCNIKDGLESSHIIIYGHNMKNGSMFGKLSQYEKADFYSSSGNDMVYIYTENKLKMYRIFSAYTSEPVSDTYTYNFPSLESLQQYASSMKAKSDYSTNVDVSNASCVLTLSTCTSDGSKRFIVQAVYVGEGILQD